MRLDLADAPREESYVGLIEVRPEDLYCTKCRRTLRGVGNHLKFLHGFPRVRRSVRLSMLGLPAGTRLSPDAVRSKVRESSRWAHANGMIPKINPASASGAPRPAPLACSARHRRALRVMAAVARARSVIRARQVITCEGCHFTVVVRRVNRIGRFCSWACSRRSAIVAMRAEQSRRAKGRTSCRRGHEYDGAINVSGDRFCRVCARDVTRAWRVRQRAAAAPTGAPS